MRYENDRLTFEEFIRKNPLPSIGIDEGRNVKSAVSQKTETESPPNLLIISRREQIRAAISGLAGGLLTYEVTRFLPEESARVTLAVWYGLGAAAADGYLRPLIEAQRPKR